MKKQLLALLLAFALVLCASCSLVRSKEQRLIREAWESTGATHAPGNVCIIRYTDRDELSNEALLPSLYSSIPASGYAVIFAPPEGTDSFDGMHTVFLNEAGDALYTFDFSEHAAQYMESVDLWTDVYPATGIYQWIPDDGSRIRRESMYFVHMQDFAIEDSQSTRDETLCQQKNVWYSLSEKQIRSLTD